jgi:outer membrane biosynthesis protein TonB
MPVDLAQVSQLAPQQASQQAPKPKPKQKPKPKRSASKTAAKARPKTPAQTPAPQTGTDTTAVATAPALLDEGALWEQDSPIKSRLAQLRARNALLDEQLQRLKPTFQARGNKP